MTAAVERTRRGSARIGAIGQQAVRTGCCGSMSRRRWGSDRQHNARQGVLVDRRTPGSADAKRWRPTRRYGIAGCAALHSLDARMPAFNAIGKRQEESVACLNCGHDRSTYWGSTRTGSRGCAADLVRRHSLHRLVHPLPTSIRQPASPGDGRSVLRTSPLMSTTFGRALGLDKMTI